MPLEMVTQREMEKVFATTDALGIHREQVVVPLGPRNPGRVRKRPDGKFEIVLDAADPDAFLAALGEALKPLL
ncbi:MAG: hypothetical protein KJ067_03345 [Vicinamibacteria bacterium]|jgi:hypothetical protein|nr:hypothetical protein [Vicinamibacteria bacterium]